MTVMITIVGGPEPFTGRNAATPDLVFTWIARAAANGQGEHLWLISQAAAQVAQNVAGARDYEYFAPLGELPARPEADGQVRQLATAIARLAEEMAQRNIDERRSLGALREVCAHYWADARTISREAAAILGDSPSEVASQAARSWLDQIAA